ncbi:MAG TPA: S8 family serine peptidase [Gemmatimonadaceae bacterium]
MSSRVLFSFVFLGAGLVAGCRDQAPIPHTPTHLIIVSGTNQSGDVSAALAQPLVVQALDGASRSVAGVPITWTVTGGGSVSAATSTTDNDGKATVTWTLAPAAGVQVVTATSTQISTASVSFVANNGAVISGTVTAAGGIPFGASFSRTVSRSSASAPTQTITRHPSPNRIVVGFKNDVVGVAAVGSLASRSMSIARQSKGLLQQRVAALSRAHGLSHAEVSPALVAARVRVDDTTQIDAVMAALRADPNVAWVERDEIISIRDGAPRPMSAMQPTSLSAGPTLGTATIAGKVPNDPGFFEQLWPATMLDLPRAWAITTGSPNVIVASVDMGIRFDHNDIAANLTNDGYDFVSQIGFGTTETLCDGSGTFTTIEGDGDGPDPDPTDPDDLEFDGNANCWFHNSLGDHGLWTAGIIGAVGNEGSGIAGVNWTVKIRPIRVLGITGDGSNFDIAQGVLYAAGLPATGADTALVQAPSRAAIISMSLGGGFPSNTLGNAVAAAAAAGSLIVASAGNDGLDFPVYPAAFPNVMAVASVGMDGALATYSNAGTFISVAAPGGDFRLDDNGGGGVIGPGWNFQNNRPTFLFGYGTSASAPFVSGIAALLLAQNPGLTAAQLRSRIEQFATRPAGFTRSDVLGWGIVNAYNALTQQNGPAHQTFVRLVDATTGAAVKSAKVGSDGSFAFTRLAAGSYLLQAGDDEAGDTLIGVAGRRFTWAGGFGKPTVFNVNANSQAVAIALGVPTEVEPNDDIAHANLLSVGSYVTGTITTPDVRDVYSVTIPTAGIYTFETSGLVGSCGLGIELDTFLTLSSAAGVTVGTNNDFPSSTGRFCSRIQATLTPGIYYITVTGTQSNGLAAHGRYRLEVRSGT